LRGRNITDADYDEMLEARQAVIRAFDKAHGTWDAILCPTVPIIAPEIHVLENNPDELSRVNAIVLRNPSAANFLDRCALTVPCHENGAAPVGLMLIGRRMEDKSLLAIGLAVEQALHGGPLPS
jgi:aspartyl-tRNA(Asn)/glutamyl-tRNA(Gln) amidotransferase subunit A